MPTLEKKSIKQNPVFKVVCILIAVCIVLLGCATTPLEGLTVEGWRMIWIVVAAIVLFISESLPLVCTCMMIIFAMKYTGAATMSDITKSAASTTTFFIMAGFGLGAAIGAKVGNPDKVVVHTTGDGCFRMNCHELATVEHYHLPIITVIFNNGCLGMVRQWQNLLYHQRFSQTTLDRGPDFVKLAEAYGLKGFRVSTRAEMEQAFGQALQAGCGCVIDCRLDMDEMVRPMVAGGAHITDFLLK